MGYGGAPSWVYQNQVASARDSTHRAESKARKNQELYENEIKEHKKCMKKLNETYLKLQNTKKFK